MQTQTKQQRRREQIRRSVRSRLARPFDGDWIRRMRRFDVHVYIGRNPPVVLIRGPRHVEDSELRACLSEHGYSGGDYLHTTDGETGETSCITSAHLFGLD